MLPFALPLALTLTLLQHPLDAVHHWLHFGANTHDAQQAPPAAHPRATPTAPSRLPGWIVGAGGANRSVGVQDVMMHRAEAELLASYLRGGDVYLEWGTGGSSYVFGGMVKKAVGIEHDCEWAEYVKRKVKERNVEIDVRCVPVGKGRGWGTLSRYEHGNYEQFKEYVDEVEKVGDKFDKVLIDGRARMACALKVLPYLRDDSIVFLHDFYARVNHYKPILNYYTEVSRVLAHRNTDPTSGPIDNPQGLLILRRRPNLTLPLSEVDIHGAYNDIDWRYPFNTPLTSPLNYLRYTWQNTDLGTWALARNAEDLVAMVRHDMLRLALLYGIVMFIVRNWKMEKPRVLGKASSAPVGRREREAVLQNKPRFVETEGMKAANARRKARQAFARGA